MIDKNVKCDSNKTFKMSKICQPLPSQPPTLFERSEPLITSKTSDSASPSICIYSSSTSSSTSPVKAEADDSGHLIIIENVENNVQIKLNAVPKVEVLPVASRTIDGSGPIFQCESCDYSSHNKHYLKQHLQHVHNSVRPFKCPFCDYAGKRSHALKEHLIVHSQVRPYECEHCNATFRKKGHLTNHVKLHTSHKNITCKLCAKVLPDISGFESHLKTDHNTDKLFTCEVCEFVTTLKTEIVKHLLTHQKETSPKNDRIYQCSLCSFSTADIGLLSAHSQSHAKGEPSLPKEVPISKDMLMKCSDCGFTSQDSQVMKDHMWNHVASKTVESITPKNIVVPQQVSGNIITAFPENATFKCTDCTFVNKDATVLVKHLLAHKVKKQTVGKPDNLQIPDQSPLLVPINTNQLPPGAAHTHPLPFVHNQATGYFCCTLCGYTCELQRTIKAHIWKHTGNKNVNYPMFQNGPLSIYDMHTPIKLELGPGKTLQETIVPQKKKDKTISADEANQESTSSEEILNGASSFPVATDILNSSSSTLSGDDVTKSDDDLEKIDENLAQSESEVEAVVPRANVAGVSFSKMGSFESLPLQSKLLSCKTSILDKSLVDLSTQRSLLCQSNLQNAHQINSTDVALSGANVLVESVNTAPPSCSLTSIKNQQSSPKASHEDSLISDSEDGPVSSDLVSDETVEETPKQEDIQQEINTTYETDNESAIALLSLLMDDHNRSSNSSPNSVNTFEEEADDVEAGGSKSENISPEEGDASPSTKPKSGICSSLLAVIEQLRERSKSESEGTFLQSRAVNLPKEYLADDDIPPESMKNIEQLEDEDGEKKYRCMLCHYSNPRALLIRLHMRLHKSKQPFECSLCSYIATSSESLQDHMIKHCKVRTYQCKLCPSAFNYKSQLRAHMRAHSEKDPFCCESCDFETMDAMTYRTHVRYHIDKSFFRCEFCKDIFPTMSDLNVHVSEMSCGNRVLSCEECEYIADDNRDLVIHVREKHRDFRCLECNFACTDRLSLTHHATSTRHSVANEDMLKCELCDFTAVSSRSLKSHMKRHINDQRFVQQPLEQYKCNLCGYVCHHLPSLKSHMWRHASDRNYSYEFTNDVINAAIDYDCRVESTRIGDRNLKEQILSSERKILEGRLSKFVGSSIEEPVCWVTFRCCQCGFETFNKADLNLHMKSHLDIIQQTLTVTGGQTRRASKRPSEDQPHLDKEDAKSLKRQDHG